MSITLNTRLFTQAMLLAGTTALCLGLSTGSAFAQEEVIEEIHVTGSRIARDPNLSGALPVQSITSEDIQFSGEFSIVDVVNDIPALLTSVTSENSIDAAAEFSDGANVLDLRGLGAQRTLVLVNGRRHVGGVQGTAAVDVGSIPTRLVERVEVLTGGASSVYGADAVSGVVNFMLKDDYEGFGIDASYGVSEDGDGAQTTLTGTWGTNFADDRGNFVISVDYRTDDGLQVRDRAGGEFSGSGRDWVNPALRFQLGEIDAGSTPNFAQYFDFNNTGLLNYGLTIPDAATFITDYNAAFPGTPITPGSLTAGELALIDRAATAPQRAVLPGRTFPFTSGFGYIIPGNAFTFDGFDQETPIDLDGNGVFDCLDSFTGYSGNINIVGGCWNVSEDGTYAPVQDGLVSGAFQGFGGDSFNTINNQLGDILLPDDKISVNLLGHFDISDSATLFGELKYVTQETQAYGGPNSFWDLLLGAPDNPYLPAFLQQTAQAAGGVSITTDPLHFDTFRFTDRDTTRAVIGLEGEFGDSWNYEVSANYGRFEQLIVNTNVMVNDRFFAAIDAVTDPATGQPACRIEVDAAAPATNTPFEIPAYEAGYFTFTPGAGQCVPLNIWAGRSGVTEDAADWVTQDTWDDLVLDQFVLSAFVSGDTSSWFELPAGPISLVLGAEYRDESSDATFDAYQRGEIPPNSALPAGSNIADVSANSSLVFRPQLSTKNESGGYDVADVFFEASIPVLADLALAQELTVGLAARFSDYSTIGTTTTWNANLVYAPVNSLAFRGTVSEAVRAPNITELFGPEIGTTFRPADPCDINQINAIRADDPTLAQQFQDNCSADFAAIGIDPTDGTGTYNFTDPLSAAFGGVQGGNRLLTEETAETVTIGFIFQPEFLQGFSFSLDYWDISIDDVIRAVSAQNIVDGCYQGANLNQNFCPLFERNADQNSPQAGGFNFLRSTSINFAKVETAGYDITAKYAFDVGAHAFDVTVTGTKVDKLDFFTNPSDLSEIDTELGEVGRPEIAGNVFLNWIWGNFQVGWQSQYMDEQLLSFVEIDTAETLYGSAVFMDSFWRHDINARYLFNDSVMVYGGIKNLTEEQPFITDFAFPSSPRGRFFFVGVDWQM
jgi:iron complex outermembrane receptor protein